MRALKIIKGIVLFFIFLIVLLLGVLGYAHYIEPNLLMVKSITIDTQKAIKPCKIVFFADTHFGGLYGEKHAEKIADKINGLNADIVIFGGDLFDNYAHDHGAMDLEYLKAELGRIKANAGKFAVWGNHDYGGGAVRIYEEFLESCGFTLLNDESRLLTEYGIRVVGFDDYLMGWTDPSLYTLESDSFNVIASHEPIIANFIQSGSDNLLLTGHTHGGQVSIPFLTSRLLPNGSGQFVKGLYSAGEIGTAASLQMYTTSGIGMTRYPFRFLNVPEIIEVNLEGADDRGD